MNTVFGLKYPIFNPKDVVLCLIAVFVFLLLLSVCLISVFVFLLLLLACLNYVFVFLLLSPRQHMSFEAELLQFFSHAASPASSESMEVLVIFGEFMFSVWCWQVF